MKLQQIALLTKPNKQHYVAWIFGTLWSLNIIHDVFWIGSVTWTVRKNRFAEISSSQKQNLAIYQITYHITVCDRDR